MTTNVLVTFYSTYGHIHRMALAVAEGAESVPDITVRLRRIAELEEARKAHDLIAPAVKERVGLDEKRASPLLNNQREGRLEIAVGRRICNDESNVDTCGCRLHLFELSSRNWVGRVDEYADSVRLGDQLAQEPNSLRPKIGSQEHNPVTLPPGRLRLAT
jgi:hypothetical protein